MWTPDGLKWCFILENQDTLITTQISLHACTLRSVVHQECRKHFSWSSYLVCTKSTSNNILLLAVA